MLSMQVSKGRENQPDCTEGIRFHSRNQESIFNNRVCKCCIKNIVASIWQVKIKNPSELNRKGFFVDPQGLEPWLPGPKPEVLPLHHGSIPRLGVQMYKFFLFYKHLHKRF